MREAYALFANPIEGWSPDRGIAVRSEARIAGVIGDAKQDVWRLLLGESSGAKKEEGKAD